MKDIKVMCERFAGDICNCLDKLYSLVLLSHIAGKLEKYINDYIDQEIKENNQIYKM